jgi:hypothetical protein
VIAGIAGTSSLLFLLSSSVVSAGITLAMDGQVSLQLSAKSVGLFEAFYNSLKPIQLVTFGWFPPPELSLSLPDPVGVISDIVDSLL